MMPRASKLGKKKLEPIDFIDQYYDKLKKLSGILEMDFSYSKDAVIVYDMSIPNAPRSFPLYTSKEIADGVYIIVGDMERRIEKFLGGK
jgi:hypothetical protein